MKIVRTYYDTLEEALSYEAVYGYLEDLDTSYWPSKAFYCPFPTTINNVDSGCGKPSTTLVAVEKDGEFYLDSMCTYHANTNGRKNQVPLLTVSKVLKVMIP